MPSDLHGTSAPPDTLVHAFVWSSVGVVLMLRVCAMCLCSSTFHELWSLWCCFPWFRRRRLAAPPTFEASQAAAPSAGRPARRERDAWVTHARASIHPPILPSPSLFFARPPNAETTSGRCDVSAVRSRSLSSPPPRPAARRFRALAPLREAARRTYQGDYLQVGNHLPYQLSYVSPPRTSI